MKILYIAPEHVSGTLALFKEEHERRGDHCRYVTFWHSRWNFPDDICLNLVGMPNRPWVRALRRMVAHDPHEVPSRVVNGRVPQWQPSPTAGVLHALRDERNWRRVRTAIEEFSLLDFDVLHLDGGADFTRDARFARAFHDLGKPVISYYHGSDLRSRGYIPAVDTITDLRITPEWDLAVLDSRLHYQYLPARIESFTYRPFSIHSPVRIGHAARNPQKGTSFIERAIVELQSLFPVEFVMIRDVSHSQALEAKASCDIFVDQLTNAGGWGYGMSGVEALAMGIPVITNIPEEMLPLIGEHPFVLATPESITSVLRELIEDRARCGHLSRFGREWVEERHDLRRVMDSQYGHYRNLGLPVG